MTHVVKEECIKSKVLDCVEVYPIECFDEGKNILVIKPNECIDCGVCEPECPIDAIKPDTEQGIEKWVEINKKYSEIWPNINKKRILLLMPIITEMKKINMRNILKKI